MAKYIYNLQMVDVPLLRQSTGGWDVILCCIVYTPQVQAVFGVKGVRC